MANNIIIGLCEGPHDVAFLHKILKSNSFKTSQNIKLAEYPRPMNQLMVEEVKKTNINELNLQTARSVLLPGSVLRKENNFVFLYSLGGDTRKEIRQTILKRLISLLPKDGKYEVIPNDTSINLLYFFDADEKGENTRYNEVKEEVIQILKDSTFDDETRLLKFNELLLGCYIFSNDDGKGKLEDLLIPLMSTGNEEIFKKANEFYEQFYDEVRGKKGADKKKAIIGVSGQLQKSGSTNTVIIGQSDYINSAKIKESSKCSSIIHFFEKFIK